VKKAVAVRNYSLVIILQNWAISLILLTGKCRWFVVKFTLEKPAKALMGSGCIAHALAALLPGKTRYPLYRRLGEPQSRSGSVRKISPPPGFDPRIVQCIPSCYTVWIIPGQPKRTEATFEGEHLRCSGILCSAEWQFHAYVSGQTIGSIFKSQVIQELIYIAAKAWNHAQERCVSRWHGSLKIIPWTKRQEN
jgi:hypothetical protein